MNPQILVIIFACILSCLVSALTVRAFLQGKKLLDAEKESEYAELFRKVKRINIAGVAAMCGAFIAAAAVSETSVLATLAMLLLVVLMILIPKIIIQSIWRCPHCGNGLELGSNRGINVKLIDQCPSCKEVLCRAMYEENH
ncbi:hypothetical protein NE619_09175 [Anaerovorax odorimutans]|uniref:DUF3784 domain-containing protein n=1 Tax=Anaerovorax odorimutans TaxID=109327 RepID=A0ABT1RNZ1_9FIRM|nr:hypothetical protein [Anaerovorax odorimutans]MCQ4636902.1 hypothetical protein [Anaerovorax odorimutans]